MEKKDKREITSSQNGLLGGRPKGSKSRLTILKEKQRVKLETSIINMSQKLINAQSLVAIGTHKMIAITVDAEGKKHVETIKDMTRMQNLLDNGEYGKDYLVVLGKEPEWKAGNALLDRAFGKATETLKVDGEIVFSLKSLAIFRKQIKDEPIHVVSEILLPEQEKK